MINFTNCDIDLLANYGGSDQKRGIIYQGERYMLKMPDRISDSKQNGLNSSYSNSVFSENISCEILNNLGFSVQKTLLGYITDINGDDKPVVACKNFVPDGYTMIDFRTIEDALLTDRKAGKIPRIKDIYEIMKGNNAYFTERFGKVALQKYWETFILDSLLGNFNRHANNWAYFIKNDKTTIQVAPIYNCGSCLYPQILDDAIPDILSSEDEIIMRIDKFQNAALELDNKTKVNYRSYINSLENLDCIAALLRIYPNINMNIIHKTINENPIISDIRKEFYITMIDKRIDRILEPAYNKACWLNIDVPPIVRENNIPYNINNKLYKVPLQTFSRDESNNLEIGDNLEL